MSLAHAIALIAVELYLLRAAAIYWRLRTQHMPQELDEFRWHIICAPRLGPAAPALLRVLPAIAELTCMVNGLLWGVELLIRPWRR